MFRFLYALFLVGVGLALGVFVVPSLTNLIPGIKGETRAITIKATAVHDVDQTVVKQTDNEIDQEAYRKFVVPALQEQGEPLFELTLITRTARGNGGCMIGSDNYKFRPYFIDSDRQRKDEVPQGARNVTLVVGPPQVLFCGITGLIFKDGSGLPVATTPIFNGLLDESFHRTVCEGNSEPVIRSAAEALKQRFIDHFGRSGVTLGNVRFGDVESDRQKPDPRFQPQRACPPPTIR